MKIVVLGSPDNFHINSSAFSLLINDRVLLDAGPGADGITTDMIPKINNVVLTHSHLDHTSMLCFLVDIRCSLGGGVHVHCLQETADAIRNGLLNDKIWPNMENIIIKNQRMIDFNIIKEKYVEMDIDGCRITPLPVIHQVPTLGYCLHGEQHNLLYMTDFIDAEQNTWEWVRNIERLKCAIFEISFSDDMEEVAAISKHLTPGMLQQLLERESFYPKEMYYCHIKPQCASKIAEQVKVRFGDRLKPLKAGMQFDI